MDIVRIPLTNDDESYDFDIELSGSIYNLNIRYNLRMDRWIMDIRDVQGENILCGLVLNIGLNLLGEYSDSRLPSGGFYVVNHESQYDDPGETDIGVNSFLYYIEA